MSVGDTTIDDILNIPSGDPTVGQTDTKEPGSTEGKGAPVGRRVSGGGKRQRSRQPPPLPKSELPKKEPSNDQIEKVTAEVLSFTALLHATPILPSLQCDYCRDHILETAPSTAKDLVKLSEQYPALRSALVGVTRFFGGVGAFSIVADLYGSSFVHHGPEIPAITPIGQVIYGQPTKKHPEGMPPRKKKEINRGNKHAHSAATAGTFSPAPESTPTEE